ncbi:fluoride efflux transporter FluC [Ligilactobacillus cholophilus]|uniref:fluoride efflux transporter FluC n=1 Tax=Ligilactobacillus cholophilus TaxID=3050131 RepID=UPI0025B1B24B|nr:CrcB family protein [Ligilactobacillus cholophilus]
MSDKTKNYLSVAFFAFFGGISRYYLGKIWQSNGTIVANLIGCFLLAFLTYYVIESDLLASWLNVGLGTGFIGAFTTFSSFTVDFMKLIMANHYLHAFLYLFISMIGGFLCVLCAYLLASKIISKKKDEF